MNICQLYLNTLRRVIIISDIHASLALLKRLLVKVRVIEPDTYFTLCENVNLGYKQWIKNEYLVEKAESIYCKDDLSTTFLSVKKDEMVKILDAGQSGYTLVKKINGLVGWIPSETV